MRVLAVCADRGIAPDGTKGASVHLRSILGAMIEAGAEVQLCSRRMPAASADLVFSVSPITELPHLINRAAFDVVYERYSLGHRDALLQARRAQVPFALEVNAPLAAEAARHRPDTTSAEDRDIEDQLWRDADLVLPVSTRLAAMIAARRGHDRGLVVVSNGIDPRLFASLPERREAADGPILLGFLGHPRPWHGTRMLVDLLGELEARGLEARLRVVGGGTGADELEEAFAACGLSERLEITGALPQREALEMLAGCTLALAPYENTEAFYFCPLKVLESLGCGLPLITHALGDIAELAGPGALLVEPGSVTAMADAVQRLHRSGAEAGRIGAAGRRHVLENFTWKMMAERVLDALRAAQARRSKRCE